MVIGGNVDSPNETVLGNFPVEKHYSVGEILLLEWSPGQHAWYSVIYAGLWCKGEQYLECSLTEGV